MSAGRFSSITTLRQEFCQNRAKASAKELLLNLPQKPRRIMIVSSGSRGDIQPYIALALGLKSRGYDVAITTNENHKGFLEEFGLKCFAPFVDTEDYLKSNEPAMEALAKGDMLLFLKMVGELVGEHKTRHSQDGVLAFETFKPDLVVDGSLAEYWRELATYAFKIPTISCPMQAAVYDPQRMSMGLPTLPFGLHRYLLWHLVVGSLYDSAKTQDDETKHLFGSTYTASDIYPKSTFIEHYSKAPPFPKYVLQSPLYQEILYPSAHPNFKLIGTPIISSELQQTRPKSFGNTTEMKNFIAAGKKPIYCGWGSMICNSPEYMAELVVRAVAHSKQRAIILGGWANLSMDCLRRATQDESLLSYAAENILFVDKAAHEWLFPQVACTVHHGGSGTLVAALRAGVPTIITPVFADQYDHAHLVNELGIGVGMKKQFQKTTAIELGDAIVSVVGNSTMMGKAEDVGRKLRAEDGVLTAVQSIEEFWVEVVLSGQFCKHIDDTIQAKLSTSGWCSCTT